MLCYVNERTPSAFVIAPQAVACMRPVYAHYSVPGYTMREFMQQQKWLASSWRA
jgi:hypothetical protein